MIGLVDWDLQQSTNAKILIPNIEIMKLATYYKIEENTFCRLISLDETDLSSYEKIFFFSETGKNIPIPEKFLRADNVIYGGTAFTRNKYVPFDNEIIDFTIARPTIYKDFLKQKYQDGVNVKTIAHVLDDSYYRMYAGDKQLPVPPIITNKRCFIYDRIFFYNNWKEIIREILDRKPSRIIPIHPIICHKISDFFSLRQEPKISRNSDVVLEINIPLKDVNYMFKKYKQLFLADINKTSKVYLSLGGSFYSSFQYFKDFIYKMNLLYSFWSYNIPIKIMYIDPELGYTDPLSTLSNFVVQWTNNTTKDNKTLQERMHSRISKELEQKLREEKELLLKFYPNAMELFRHNYSELQERGIWVL